jgi:integrase
MSRGNITRRGRNSWRIRFDLDADATGQRRRHYATVHGKRQDAQRELTRLLGAAHAGTLVEPSSTTVADYLRSWLDGAHGLAGKTLERYRQLAEQQIIPHLGAIALQKLRPAHIADWHATLLRAGGRDGAPLSARTVGHAHRVLYGALARATKSELLLRNVAAVIAPPKAEQREIDSLKADQIATVLQALDGQPLLQPTAVLALSTGARRGEILGLTWSHIDLDRASMKIERSLEQTRAGLKFKSPKTKTSRRTVSLPPSAVEALRAHRRAQLELRLALGQGRPDSDALVFSRIDGSPVKPSDLSRDWARFVQSRKLPRVSFHGLRHSHVSALIARGVDVLTIARRIGHVSASTTLRVYGHMFEQNDSAAVDAIEAALRGGKA